MYKKVPHPSTGKRLFDFDSERGLIRIAKRGEPVVIDLTDYGLVLGRPSTTNRQQVAQSERV